jgi:hypothetical protein
MNDPMKIRKLDIAIEYLDAAMQMYIDRKNFFCAIHLAEAAAELFDAHLPEENRIRRIAWLAQKQMHLSENGKEASNEQINMVMSGTKNAIKHMNDGERCFTVDPISEAEWSIEQAIVSFERLGLEKTATLWKFQDCRNTEMRL